MGLLNFGNCSSNPHYICVNYFHPAIVFHGILCLNISLTREIFTLPKTCMSYHLDINSSIDIILHIIHSIQYGNKCDWKILKSKRDKIVLFLLLFCVMYLFHALKASYVLFSIVTTLVESLPKMLILKNILSLRQWDMFKITNLNRVLGKPLTSRLQITGYKMHRGLYGNITRQHYVPCFFSQSIQLFMLGDHGSSECLHDILKCDHSVKGCWTMLS